MILSSLVIEVTRKCNMACEHCLRGCSQNIDISNKTIEKIFDGVETVYSLNFTGGEPFLNIDAIEYTLNYVKEHGIEVYSVYVVTNGKHFEERYISVMNEWVMYCVSCNVNLNVMLESSENIMSVEDLTNYSGLSVSRDEFHESIPIANYIRYKMLAYYSEAKERQEYGNTGLLLEGNAYDNGFAGREFHPSRFDFEDWTEEEFETGDVLVNNLVYVSSLGEVLADCDCSYRRMAEESIGNINENCLLDLFREYARKEMVA